MAEPKERKLIDYVLRGEPISGRYFKTRRNRIYFVKNFHNMPVWEGRAYMDIAFLTPRQGDVGYFDYAKHVGDLGVSQSSVNRLMQRRCQRAKESALVA